MRQKFLFRGSGGGASAIGSARIQSRSLSLLKLMPHQKRRAQCDDAQRNYLLPIMHS